MTKNPLMNMTQNTASIARVEHRMRSARNAKKDTMNSNGTGRGKEQTMNDDLIKRSDAIKAVESEDCFAYIECKAEVLYNRINAIPSADRPQGKWIETDRLNCGARVYQCSICGEDIDEMPTVMGVPKYRFCPYCRAKMKGADDE